MTTLPTPPPYFADETAMLRAFLDHNRDTILRQTEGLDADQLSRSLHPTSMTLGGLLKHLSRVEQWWFAVHLAGTCLAPPFDHIDWAQDPDWEWHSATADTPERLRSLLLEAIERSNAILDSIDSLDVVAATPHSRRGDISARWILIHMIEEYARHAGHADLLREAIDGATAL